MSLDPTLELLAPFPLDSRLGAVPLGRRVFVLAPTLERVSLAESFGFFSGGELSFSGSELEEDEEEASSGEVLRFLCGGREKEKEEGGGKKEERIKVTRGEAKQQKYMYTLY